ncbi:DUF2922 domain-containing protein [Bacillus sp. DTU_2020_1000418_1_SI_GHA_SEK_038]|uniref:DUF2922 domain-containing protein n=1 Tax=Bacillus sp. DTU_2020_1000418_1_SI_GHA_SEK_038 TaxID=3077585 RepID=UPI0028E72189|nr:DUF2922 domain-containing protein [Bacillus sp. DTU_2020_1000418_1_SI_GHA_SEK_038]WNS75235.1 DUF2922 domain-containing protein [Bacillus sp. DTU_2020_1000418_1_SI_GHA_SEK_038]
MAKSLELTFVTDSGKLSRLSIDNPKEPIDPVAVKLAMEQIVAADVFQTMNGNLVSAKEARVIERNVTAYELV